MCKGPITKCPVFGSGNSEEAMVLRAHVISFVSLDV